MIGKPNIKQFLGAIKHDSQKPVNK